MSNHRSVRILAAMALAALVVAGCATGPKPAPPAQEAAEQPLRPFPEDAWRGVHIYLSGRDDLPLLHRAITEVLAPRGANTLILEIDYNYQFTSHPEVGLTSGMNKQDARELAALCRAQGIRLIPQFQCFGHQGHRPIGLLAAHPELMAPPNPDYSDPHHYHVSWNPLHPKTNEIVFALIDELIDAFQPEYFHVGLDEVMLFPDDTTPFYSGESHAEVFAKAVNDLYAHVVTEKGLTMLMWGDRLIPKSYMTWSSYETSHNGTEAAIDLIPKDIIICDWHYLYMPNYRSVRLFLDKGFRVWPTSWKSPSAALAFYRSSQRDATDRMLGHLCSSWCGMGSYCQALLGEGLPAGSTARDAADTFQAVADEWLEGNRRAAPGAQQP
ncbi:MAG: family 20 glycosylhydrolase [Candidatus Hydrogenedentes bacterium]|nr:family 20 glycosylhydrolase [Candidatus Hydrogenedentota bacterium]